MSGENMGKLVKRREMTLVRVNGKKAGNKLRSINEPSTFTHLKVEWNKLNFN